MFWRTHVVALKRQRKTMQNNNFTAPIRLVFGLKEKAVSHQDQIATLNYATPSVQQTLLQLITGPFQVKTERDIVPQIFM